MFTGDTEYFKNLNFFDLKNRLNRKYLCHQDIIPSASYYQVKKSPKKSRGAIAISLQFSCKLVNLSLQIGNLTVRLFLLLLLLITQGYIGIQ